MTSLFNRLIKVPNKIKLYIRNLKQDCASWNINKMIITHLYKICITVVVAGTMHWNLWLLGDWTIRGKLKRCICQNEKDLASTHCCVPVFRLRICFSLLIQCPFMERKSCARKCCASYGNHNQNHTFPHDDKFEIDGSQSDCKWGEKKFVQFSCRNCCLTAHNRYNEHCVPRSDLSRLQMARFTGLIIPQSLYPDFICWESTKLPFFGYFCNQWQLIGLRFCLSL